MKALFKRIVVDKENKIIKIRNAKNVEDKINKIITKNDISSMVLSKDLYSLKDKLNCKVLTGERLLNLMLYDAIKKILELINKDEANIHISILVNNNNGDIIDNVLELARETKIINIVTENISQFLKVQENIYNSYGVLIKISNNKRKDLLRSDIIVNIDFSEEKINKYIINREAVIINVNNDSKIKDKKFVGINIKEYIIKFPQNFKAEGFNPIHMYEASIYDLSFKKAIEKLNKDSIHIMKFVGSNGAIAKEEFIRLNN